MEHTNVNKVFNKKGKKATGVTAIFVAGALVVSGAVATALYKGNTVSPETTIETGVNDELNSLLVLTEDFDINDTAAVKERAAEIYNLSEKDYDVVDITNMIYILGEKYESIIYPASAKTDKQKFQYLQNLALLLGTVLDDGLYSYFNAVSGDTTLLGELSPVVSGYEFLPGAHEAFVSAEGLTEEQVQAITNEKNNAIELAKICYTQMSNIKNNIDNCNKDALIATAESFYDFYINIENLEVSDSNKFMLYKMVDAKRALFTPYLTAEKAARVDEVSGKVASYQNIIFQKAAAGLDISEILADGNFGKDTTPLGESYNASDEKDAATHPAVQNDNANSTTRVVEEGGKPINGNSGKQEVINNPTTSVHTEEIIVTVPSTTKPSQKVEEGGKVVEEETFVVDIGSYEGTTRVVIEEGGVILEEKYVDADAAKAEELGNTYTLG